ISADDTIERAARLMEENDCGCIPVTGRDRDEVIGVVTDRDIAVRAVGHGRSTGTAVRDVMTPSPLCCSPVASVEEVEQLMADRQVRRVVVVDDADCPVGMIAQADLARAAEEHRGISSEELAYVVERISEYPREDMPRER